MKVSWKYLNDFIDLTNINIINIKNKLTLAGLEVEDLIYKKAFKDTVFNISLTANRKDYFGLVHIAIELSALFKQSLKIKKEYKKTTKESPLYIITETPSKEDSFLPYLYFLPINTNITTLDKINFINLKWGQKLKAYQLSSLDIKYLNKIDLHISLNNNYKYMHSSNEVDLKEINQNNIKDTRNIIIFNQTKVNDFSFYAYKELIEILKIKKESVLIQEKSTDTYFKHKELNSGNSIICNIPKIQQILGPIDSNTFRTASLKVEKIKDILERLHFNITTVNNQLIVKVPNERNYDLQNEVDIIEEVGRIYGFNNFIDKMPTFHQILPNNTFSQIKGRIRRILRSHGIHEIINYSFENTPNNKQYTIINPLNKEQSTLRSNLIENLILSKRYNLYQNNYEFEVFEIGTVFTQKSKKGKYKESLHLSCLIGNEYFNQSTWQNLISPITWHQVKGQIEDLFEKLNANVSWSRVKLNNNFIDNINPYIHPTKTIYINDKTETIGVLSQLNYRIKNLLNLNYNIYFLEIDIIKLSATVKDHNHLTYNYLLYPNYPKVTRDISLQINKKVSMQKLANIISTIKNDPHFLIESIETRTEYYNHKEHKTICLRVNYRSLHKTLTNSEIEILNNDLIEIIQNKIKSKT